jgi:cytochrome b6-f complex iron-sulfur subunit
MASRPQLSMNDSLSRRAVMTGVVAVSGGAVLAACGSSSSGSSTDGAPAASPSASPSSGGSAPAPAGAGGAIVALSAVPVGGSVAAELDGKPIIVSQPTAGKAVAFTAICTHKGCPVKPAGATLKCPCHGSVYNALTGANVSGPAPSPLAEIPVTVTKGNVVAA